MLRVILDLRESLREEVKYEGKTEKIVSSQMDSR